MVADELKKYITDSLASGNTLNSIERNLIEVGWSKTSIAEAFQDLGASNTTRPDSLANGKSRTSTFRHLFVVANVVIIAILLGSTLYLWQDRLDLRDTNALETREFYTRIAESQIAFTDAGRMVFPDEQKLQTEKSKYLESKTSFIEVNLKTMTLSLFENGTFKKDFPVVSKGKEKSWWETPTGNYSVLGKSINGYSSIGQVWMPYSIQFYGNYLIHGWPHYDDGTPVPAGYSGGCIRLTNEHAKEVFIFAKPGMPVLVLEDYSGREFGTLTVNARKASLPEVSAQSFLVYDISTGETLLEKNADEKRAIASLTKLMTAVVAHEVIYLGRSVKTTPPLLAGGLLFSPVVGERYIGLDLLYPLLMQSSNASAKILASFVGEEVFIRNMNAKASSLEMFDTSFSDASGISAGNISTTRDIALLLRYIYYKRPFLFEISRGVIFENIGLLRIGNTIPIKDLRNVNEFIDRPDLIGVKNGKTTAAGETMTTVWNVPSPQGSVPVAIIVLGSTDRGKDTLLLHTWLTDNFSYDEKS